MVALDVYDMSTTVSGFKCLEARVSADILPKNDWPFDEKAESQRHTLEI